MGGIAENLSGIRFGRWTVKYRDLYREGRVAWICSCDCGTIKSVRAKELKNGDSQSCGCYCLERNREHKSGPGNPFYIDGRSQYTRTERENLMRQSEYINWRKQVFLRDNYTCQMCGARGSGTYLNADHILSWAQHPENRYDVDNGRTLCVECHRTTDTWGSRGIVRE